MVGVVTRTYNGDDPYPILSKLNYGCLLALCGPTMHVATLCGGFWTIFFLLSVHSSLKKNRALIHIHSFENAAPINYCMHKRLPIILIASSSTWLVR